MFSCFSYNTSINSAPITKLPWDGHRTHKYWLMNVLQARQVRKNWSVRWTAVFEEKISVDWIFRIFQFIGCRTFYRVWFDS